MALTALTLPSVNPINGASNATPQACDENNGNKITYSRNLIVHFQETGASNPSTITCSSNPNAEGKSKSTTLTIAASGEGFMGPFDEDFSKGGFLEFTFTGTGAVEATPINFIPA